MSKNKNKNRNNHQNNQAPKIAQSPLSSFPEDQKREVETTNDQTQQWTAEQGIVPEDNLSGESERKFNEAEAKNELSKYWVYVKDINRRLDALLSKAEDERDKTLKLKDEVELSKKENDSIKSDLRRKSEDLNRKDKEITEREFALDNGEYSGVIQRLLNTLKDTEKKVFTDTENLLKELAEFHKKNLEDYLAHQKDSSDFESQVSDLKRDRKKFEIEKELFAEDLKSEYENKFGAELSLKTAEFERLSRKVAIFETENNKLKRIYEDLKSSFDSVEPEEILKRYAFLKTALDEANKELNERPDQFEYEAKQAQIEELQAKVTEYKNKVNEGELLELKRILSNMDSYVIEINAYKNQIESAKVREVSLKKTITDLSITIDQLKGESSKMADAFEFARKIDSDMTNLGYNHLEKNMQQPASLKELASYIQYWMVQKSDKPFYYSLETIRIFMAGLHMSPISILQGISGTGKTSLPREFAKSLISDAHYTGLDSYNSNNAPYRICAIQSGWRDNMDLMGYYNSFEHKYKETDFFKALYLANQPKYSDTLFLIILDEMNLSRPEHYFADFLSLLEQSPNERYITLSNTPDEVLPDSIRGGRLKVPENVRFIGTANHDETTLEFAPKTYDRSNLMEMPKNLPDKRDFKQSEMKFNVTYQWLSSKFVDAVKANVDSFGKFHSFINSDDIKLLLLEKGIGVGNRLEYQAEKFIGVYIDSGIEKEKDLASAVDHLITSRLFRSLKNRYDLDKGNLTKFKDDYVKLFERTFLKQKPFFALDLLDNEIAKK